MLSGSKKCISSKVTEATNEANKTAQRVRKHWENLYANPERYPALNNPLLRQFLASESPW